MFATALLVTAIVGGGHSVTVQPGNTLSGIAASSGVSLASVEAANSQIANFNLIYAGQVITVPGSGYTATVRSAPAGGSYGHPYFCGDGDGDGWDLPCSALHRGPAAPVTPAPVQQYAAVPQPVQQAPAPSYSAPSGGGFQSCVIRRESGGNARAVNPSSGAGGLYQFLPSTWAGLGYSGSPQNASVATQNQAFQKLYAQAGSSPWSPSDHC